MPFGGGGGGSDRPWLPGWPDHRRRLRRPVRLAVRGVSARSPEGRRPPPARPPSVARTCRSTSPFRSRKRCRASRPGSPSPDGQCATCGGSGAAPGTRGRPAPCARVAGSPRRTRAFSRSRSHVPGVAAPVPSSRTPAPPVGVRAHPGAQEVHRSSPGGGQGWHQDPAQGQGRARPTRRPSRRPLRDRPGRREPPVRAAERRPPRARAGHHGRSGPGGDHQGAHARRESGAQGAGRDSDGAARSSRARARRGWEARARATCSPASTCSSPRA